MSYSFRAGPLSRSALHCAVQPPVNALGNQASTTVLPLYSDSLCVFPSDPGSEKSGAVSPTFSSGPAGWAAGAGVCAAAETLKAATSQAERNLNMESDLPCERENRLSA